MKWIPLAMAFATSSSLLAESEKQDSGSVTSSEFALKFEHPEIEPDWHPVNDSVMGGHSKGEGKLKDGKLVFEGKVSLENNYGFSSVRTNSGLYDFSGAEGIALRVKGDGHTYQLRLATNARYQGSLISYQQKFETKRGEWTEIKVPFNKLRPGWRRHMMSGHVLDASRVTQLGILIGDQQEGDFCLEVDWVKTYRTGEGAGS